MGVLPLFESSHFEPYYVYGQCDSTADRVKYDVDKFTISAGDKRLVPFVKGTG